MRPRPGTTFRTAATTAGDNNAQFTVKVTNSLGSVTSGAATLDERRHPEHGYRSCRGLKSLARRYTPERIEAACERALIAGARSYLNVESILKNQGVHSRHGHDACAYSPVLPAVERQDRALAQDLEADVIRPGQPNTLDDAHALVARWVERYNTVRLHSAISYIAPADSSPTAAPRSGRARHQT